MAKVEGCQGVMGGLIDAKKADAKSALGESKQASIEVKEVLRRIELQAGEAKRMV